MSALIIANTQIRCDASGRYCLNDLHLAAGAEARHKPGNWLSLEKTRELIAELKKPDESPGTVAGIPATDEPLITLQGGFVQGTYAVKELVYAYAMWISAAFHLHVIRAYDALVTARLQESAPVMLAGPQHRADQFVSAGRIFGAAMRTARTLRMPPKRAMLAAFECARRHAGVDWIDELQAGDLRDELGKVEAPEDFGGVFAFRQAWQDGSLGVPVDLAITTDLHELYLTWCQTRGIEPLYIPRFVPAILADRSLRLMRRRVVLEPGRETMRSFITQLHVKPHDGVPSYHWLGRRVAEFRQAMQRSAVAA